MKRSFSLIEVLIGLALAALVLGMLFTSLRETSQVSARLKRGEVGTLSRVYIQQRLDSIFSHSEGEGTFFLIEEEDKPSKLHMAYWCGIDPDPHFSGEVLASLQLEEGRFCLRVKGNLLSPDEDPPHDRVEILKHHVKRLDYEFLNQREVFTSWEKKNASPPDFLKLTLTLESNAEEEYVFWINKKPEGVLIP